MSSLSRTAAARRQLFVLRQLVRRDLTGPYAGSLLGLGWPFVRPLVQLALYTFVFGAVLRLAPGDGRGGESFAVFLFAGLLPWMGVQEGLERATGALTGGAGLLRQHRLGGELLVLSAVVAALLHQAIATAVFAAVLAARGAPVWQGLPLLCLALALQGVLTLGLGLALASAQVLIRDTAQLVALLLTAWFFLTPIVYPPSLVPERFTALLEANPLTPLVALYRSALLGPHLAPRGVAYLAAAAAIALAAGLLVFVRLRATLVDEV